MQQQQEKRGRSKPRDPGTYQRVTLELPVDLWRRITEATDNRTLWLIEAAQEKLAREGKNEFSADQRN